MKHWSGLLAAAAVTGAGLGVLGTAADAATAPPVVLSFASTALALNQPIVAHLCGDPAAAGSSTFLQEQEGTQHVWRAVGSPLAVSGRECGTLRLATPNMGRFLFRFRYWAGGQLRYVSPEQHVTVYGPVNFSALCNDNGASCSLNPGTAEIAGHLENYLTEKHCYLGYVANCLQPFASYTFSSNSCRSLSMTSTMSDINSSETPGDTITIAVVQHTLNEQSTTVPYGAVSTARFALDGGPLQIAVTYATGQEDFYLISATADCYTPTGAAS